MVGAILMMLYFLRAVTHSALGLAANFFLLGLVCSELTTLSLGFRPQRIQGFSFLPTQLLRTGQDWTPQSLANPIETRNAYCRTLLSFEVPENQCFYFNFSELLLSDVCRIFWPHLPAIKKYLPTCAYLLDLTLIIAWHANCISMQLTV